MATAEQVPVVAASGIVPEWSLGERLAKARHVAGLSQDAMAKRLSVSASAIAAWETNRNSPREFMVLMDQWAEITGVDLAWILGFRTGSFSPLVGLPSTLTPELPFPAADRQLAAV